MARLFKVMSVLASVALAASVASAQSGTTTLVLPEDAPRDVRTALRIELQLSGRIVRMATPNSVGDRHAARELAAHAEGEVISIAESPRGVVLRRVAAGRRSVEMSLDGSLAAVGPRSVALLVAGLLDEALAPLSSWPRARGAVALAPPASDVVPETVGPVTPPPSGTGVDLAEPPTVELPRTIPSVGERIGFEILGGGLLGIAFGVGGALVAEEINQAAESFPYWAIGLNIMGTLGTTAGVLFAGLLTGADGDPWWALLAGVGGGVLAAAFLGLGALTDEDMMDGIDSAWTIVGTLAAAVLPLTFSVLAFELTVPDENTPRVQLGAGPGGVGFFGEL